MSDWERFKALQDVEGSRALSKEEVDEMYSLTERFDAEAASAEAYRLTDTASGYAVRRANGDLAEFLDSEDAEEALALLQSGEKAESDYEWLSVE